MQLEEDLRKQLVDFETDSRECRQKEAELLSYTEKLTENNAHWKSKACDLQSRVRNFGSYLVFTACCISLRYLSLYVINFFCIIKYLKFLGLHVFLDCTVLPIIQNFTAPEYGHK